jgi:hypothetical protein
MREKIFVNENNWFPKAIAIVTRVRFLDYLWWNKGRKKKNQERWFLQPFVGVPKNIKVRLYWMSQRSIDR